MRSLVLSLVVLIGALPHAALAQAQPLIRAVAKHVPMPTFDLVDYKLQCPAGYVPNGYSATPQYPFDINEDQFRLFIDRNGSVVDKSTVSSVGQLDGAGYSLSVYNTEHHDKNLEALAFCVALSASADNTFQLVRTSGNIARATLGTVTSFCPADSPVAFGGFSNADAVAIQDYGGGPVWGTSASPTVLSSLADGTTMGPPTGWQVRVYNVFSSNTEVVAYALCGKSPAMQAYIYAVNAPGITFGVATPFSIFAPVPEGMTAVGMGYDGGQVAHYVASDAWLDDGTVVSAMQWYPTSGELRFRPGASSRVHGKRQRNIDRWKGSGGRVGRTGRRATSADDGHRRRVLPCAARSLLHHGQRR
jgi:hypothetical protein